MSGVYVPVDSRHMAGEIKRMTFLCLAGVAGAPCTSVACRHDVILHTDRGSLQLPNLDSYTVFVMAQCFGTTLPPAHLSVHTGRLKLGLPLCVDRIVWVAAARRAVLREFGFKCPAPLNENLAALVACRREKHAALDAEQRAAVENLQHASRVQFGPPPRYGAVLWFGLTRAVWSMASAGTLCARRTAPSCRSTP